MIDGVMFMVYCSYVLLLIRLWVLTCRRNMDKGSGDLIWKFKRKILNDHFLQFDTILAIMINVDDFQRISMTQMRQEWF